MDCCKPKTKPSKTPNLTSPKPIHFPFERRYCKRKNPETKTTPQNLLIRLISTPRIDSVRKNITVSKPPKNKTLSEIRKYFKS